MDFEKEAIPQEDLVRAYVRDRVGNSAPRRAYQDYKLEPNNLIGWFANVYNMASGWEIYLPSEFDKDEFGRDVLRTYSDKTNTTNIIRFNLLTGMYSFIDSKAYENGVVKFQPMAKYDRLFIDPTSEAFVAFNIV